jgi:hypothetical protein
MQEQFVPYEIALKLQEKGFDWHCLAVYMNGEFQIPRGFGMAIVTKEHVDVLKGKAILAPLWQQAIDWFAEKHNIDISTPPFWSGDGRQYSTIIYLKSTGSIASDDENTFHLFPEKDTKQEAQLMAIEHALTLI